MEEKSKPKIRRRDYPGFFINGKRRDTFYALSIVNEHAPLNCPNQFEEEVNNIFDIFC
jgi:hypothetical protein